MEINSVIDFKNRVLRITKYTSFLLALFLLGALSPFKSIFMGLALGTIVSLLNFLFTARKMNKIGEIVSTKHSDTKTRPMSSGMLTRFALVFIAIMVVYKFPDSINIFSTLAGLFVTQITLVVDGIINSF